ncbi:hypothetical protein TH62_01850 [Bacillus sp. TH008]|nr:hypothetical protein TH62_01850 [Bacillus sp. TH008]
MKKILVFPRIKMMRGIGWYVVAARKLLKILLSTLITIQMIITDEMILAQFWRNVGTLFCFRSFNMVLGQKQRK